MKVRVQMPLTTFAHLLKVFARPVAQHRQQSPLGVAARHQCCPTVVAANARGGIEGYSRGQNTEVSRSAREVPECT